MKETELDNGTIDNDLEWLHKNRSPGKKVLFSDTYMENKQVLVTAKDSNITSFDAMKDKSSRGTRRIPLAMIPPSAINEKY